MKSALEKLFKRQIFSRQEACASMKNLVSGNYPPEQIAAFLGALRCRGETAEELAGFLDAILEQSQKVELRSEPLLDVCGTGGDASSTFNVSTAAAIVIAALNVPVAKHGNRSISSICGSVDVLEALGVTCTTSPQQAVAQFESHSITFLFAPHFHPALKTVGPIRKAIGARTTFNILGPIANPACATHQLVGVFEPTLTRAVSQALCMRGSKRALVIHSDDGLDELSPYVRTRGHLWDGKSLQEFVFDPKSLPITSQSISDLKGGDARTNARIISDAFSELGTKSHQEVIALNAGAGLFVSGYAKSVEEGFSAAYAALRDGRAAEKLRSLQAEGKPT